MTDAAALEKKQRRRLVLVLLVTTGFCGIELVGAMLARSDVLKADALHLLLDIGALSMSLLAMRIATRPPSDRYPFGLRRAEPLAALVNGVLVLLAAIYIVVEGIESLKSGHAPVPGIMMGVSVLALIINGTSAYLLHGAMGHDHGHDHIGHAHVGPTPAGDCAEGHDHEAHPGRGHPVPHPRGPHDAHAHEHHEHHEDEHDDHGHEAQAHHGHGHTDHSLNLRGAWLHLMGDALGALAAFVAAVAIWLGAPRTVDPIASFLVAGILLVGALQLLRDALRVLLEAAPTHLALADVRRTAEEAAEHVHVLDAHAWTLGAGHHAVGLRVSAKGTSAASEIENAIREKHGVTQVWVHVVPSGAGSGRGATPGAA